MGEAEALGVEPAHFPELVIRAPDCAEALGALAQVGFVVSDAHGDHFFVAAPGAAITRRPGDGLDDQFDGLVAAAVLGVVAVTYADEPFAVAFGIFFWCRPVRGGE